MCGGAGQSGVCVGVEEEVLDDVAGYREEEGGE